MLISDVFGEYTLK